MFWNNNNNNFYHHRRPSLRHTHYHRMEEEIDLGVWFRRLVLGAAIIFLFACSIKIGAAFWVEWNVGNVKHKKAGITLKRCAGGTLEDTSHFQDACKTAQRDRAKDPLIYAIEHTWKELWPCKTAMCLEVVIHATRSMWTILAAALILTLVALYFTGCSGIRSTQQPMVWSCPPQHQIPYPHGYSKSVTVDIGTNKQE